MMSQLNRNTLFGAVLCLVLATANCCKARAETDYGSGNQMLPHCEHYVSRNANFDVWDGECGGVVSTLMFFRSLLQPKYSFCAPDGVINEQAARVLVKYLRSHPERLHLNLRGLANDAFREAWPCR